jgi:hypothetical protein
MKKLYTFSIGLIVLLLMAASASAASDSKTSGSGADGYATWDFTNDDGQSMYAYIDVYEEPDGNTTIYLGFSYYDADDVYHSFWGDMTTTEDVFTVDKRLASASLSEVSIDGNYYTEEAGSSIGTATITADWTGVEDIAKITYTVKDGTFYSVKGTSRDAIATGSIIDPEGNELIGDESTEYAYIELFNFLEIIRKK